MKKCKMLLKVILCAVLVVQMSLVPVAAAEVNLTDVDVNDPSNDKIYWAIEQGYMSPVLGRFFPDKKVNRGEFACILSKVTKDISSLKKPTKPTFQDVSKNYQYYRHIETMKTYINYYKNKSGAKLFKPKTFITKEDAAMSVVKLLGFDKDEALQDSLESDISVEEFINDFNKISPSNVKYVEITIVNQLMDFRIDNKGNVYFDPKKEITRKELASLLWNAEQQKNYLKEQHETTNEEDDVFIDDDYDQDDETVGDWDDNDDDYQEGAESEWPWSRDINVKFVDDKTLLGDWEAVALVRTIDDFYPEIRQEFGLYLNDLSILPNGKTNLS